MCRSAVWLLALLSCAAYAQVDAPPRQLTVTALDTHGAPITGARVELCNLDVGAKDAEGTTCSDHFTSDSGKVTLTVRPAHYEIRVTLEGFLPTTLGPLRLRESEQSSVSYRDLVAVLNDEIVE